MTVAPGRAALLVIKDFPDPAMARRLSPNGRAHWTKKLLARNYVHGVVHYTVRVTNLEPMGPGLIAIWPTFIYPVVRKRDDDNLATGVMKAVRDALVRLKILEADDTEHLKQMPVEVRVEKGRRALELRIEREEPR